MVFLQTVGSGLCIGYLVVTSEDNCNGFFFLTLLPPPTSLLFEGIGIEVLQYRSGSILNNNMRRMNGIGQGIFCCVVVFSSFTIFCRAYIYHQ